MFDVSAGILLEKTYHNAYDALKWSLYLKVRKISVKCRTELVHVLTCKQDDTLYVHYFNPGNETQRALNGLALDPSRFRALDKPDPVLVAWHYTQAVRMRIRGYSVGMRPPRSRGLSSARRLPSESG